jgi:branched-chain amino acid transport system ATP-binding protein
MSILQLEGVSKVFGGLHALDDVDLAVEAGEIVGLIGPNGAGKTTLVNAVTGVFPLTQGRITFDGRSLVGLKPHQISRLGVARTYQVVQPFPEMTALENVMAPATLPEGRAARRRRGVWRWTRWSSLVWRSPPRRWHRS